MARNSRARPKEQSSSSEEADGQDQDQASEPSTSSDEDVGVGRGNSKRQRKFYQPDEDALFDMEDESDSLIDLETSEESIPEKERRKKPGKKRHKSVDAEGSQSATDAEYDEDEAALKHALALSLANTPEEGGPSLLERPLSSRRVSIDESRRKYDPEENALQQAIAASMTEAEGVLDSMRVTDAGDEGPFSTAKGSSKPSSQRTSRFASPTKESKPIAIDGHDSAGKGAAKSKARKKLTKPAFEQPSVQMVQQAFTMLDPRGRGQVSAAALQQVASKLLHKELDRDQLDAMLEFAQSMASTDDESIPGIVDAEGFCRLVARFAEPSSQ